MQSLENIISKKVSIWERASRIVFSQWSAFLGTLLMLLPIYWLFHYMYPSYSLWLLWRVSFRELTWQGYYGLLGCWILLPFLFATLYAMAILGVREGQKRKVLGSQALFQEAIPATFGVGFTLLCLVFASWVFICITVEVKNLMNCKYGFSYEALLDICQWVAIPLFFLLLFGFTRSHSFAMQAYLLYGGSFSEAIKRSRVIAKKNNCKIRRHDCLFLLLLAIVPLFMLLVSFLLGEPVEKVWLFSPALSLLLLMIFSMSFLFVAVARTFLFLDLEEKASCAITC